MQHFGFAPSLLQMLRQLPAMLVCLAMLAGCEAVSLFDDAKGIEQAISALRERLGRRVFVLKLLIAPDQITIRVQDLQNRSRVDEWRFERMRVAWLNWERTSSNTPKPQRYEMRRGFGEPTTKSQGLID